MSISTSKSTSPSSASTSSTRDAASTPTIAPSTSASSPRVKASISLTVCALVHGHTSCRRETTAVSSSSRAVSMTAGAHTHTRPARTRPAEARTRGFFLAGVRQSGQDMGRGCRLAPGRPAAGAGRAAAPAGAPRRRVSHSPVAQKLAIDVLPQNLLLTVGPRARSVGPVGHDACASGRRPLGSDSLARRVPWVLSRGRAVRALTPALRAPWPP